MAASHAHGADQETCPLKWYRPGECGGLLLTRSNLTAVDVKRSAQVRSNDLHGLRAFGADYPEATLVLLYGGTQRERHGTIWCLPVEEALIALDPARGLAEGWGI